MWARVHVISTELELTVQLTRRVVVKLRRDRRITYQDAVPFAKPPFAYVNKFFFILVHFFRRTTKIFVTHEPP